MKKDDAMYKRILVAVDNSETSQLALQEAITLSKELGAKLRLLHVVDEQLMDISGMGIDYGVYEASLKENGQKLLKRTSKIVQQSKVEFDSELVELKTFEGRIADRILEAAKSWQADLLVIGTHGRRGFNRLLLGSVAEGVIRIATIPVLLIRGKPNKE